MEKKTIGQFIAALRKANGLTQQEVADRLSVSNKAVSRWERDECAPDISVIPALAELLGVTCDELLRGERITNTAQAEKSEQKVDKQVKLLINQTISSFKIRIWVSLAVSVLGLFSLLFIPFLWFAYFQEIVALIIVVIAINKMKEAKTDNELFERATQAQVDRYNRFLGKYSYWAVFAVVVVIVLSFSVIPFQRNFLENMIMGYWGVPDIVGFISMVLFPNVIFLTYIYLKAKNPYIAWITEQPYTKEEKESNPILRKMNILQIGAIVLAGIMFLVAPFFETDPKTVSPIYTGFQVAGMIFLGLNIVCFIVFLIRNASCRKDLIFPGIRNILLIPVGYMSRGIHALAYDWEINGHRYNLHDVWSLEPIIWMVVWSLLAIALVGVVEMLFAKRKG